MTDTIENALYIVATPIGNLQDISLRAVQVLSTVAQIAVEDSRHSKALLTHLGINKPVLIVHDHNERSQIDKILDYIANGQAIALISDAGTPLINDPGFNLVTGAHLRKIRVISIPGPCAAITALTSSGLATDKFTFEGFLPSKEKARLAELEVLAKEFRTMIFYEAPHRIMATLQNIIAVFGEERQVCLAREMTKKFETIITGAAGQIYKLVNADLNQQKGEMVLVVAGYKPQKHKKIVDPEALRVLKILQQELPPNKAASLAAKITGIAKKLLYSHLII